MTRRDVKIVLIGDDFDGKFELLSLITNAPHQPHEIVGASFESHDYTDFRGNSYSFTIWNVSGDPRYRELSEMYLRGANIIFGVYNELSRYDQKPSSFDILKDQLDHLFQHYLEYDKYYIINLVDDANNACSDEGEVYARRNRCHYELLDTDYIQNNRQSFRSFFDEVLHDQCFAPEVHYL